VGGGGGGGGGGGAAPSNRARGEGEPAGAFQRRRARPNGGNHPAKGSNTARSRTPGHTPRRAALSSPGQVPERSEGRGHNAVMSTRRACGGEPGGTRLISGHLSEARFARRGTGRRSEEVPPGYAPCRATWTGFKGPRRRLAGRRSSLQGNPQGEAWGGGGDYNRSKKRLYRAFLSASPLSLRNSWNHPSRLKCRNHTL
jgi:hypothetical protein